MAFDCSVFKNRGFLLHVLVLILAIIIYGLCSLTPLEFLEPGYLLNEQNKENLVKEYTSKGQYASFLNRLYTPYNSSDPARLSTAQYADFVDEKLVLPRDDMHFDNFRHKYMPPGITTSVRGVVWSELTSVIPSFVWDDMEDNKNDGRYPLSTKSTDYTAFRNAINDQRLNDLMVITEADHSKLYKMLKIGRRVHKFTKKTEADTQATRLILLSSTTEEEFQTAVTRKAPKTWIKTDCTNSKPDDESKNDKAKEEILKYKTQDIAYLDTPLSTTSNCILNMEKDTTFTGYLTDQELRSMVNATDFGRDSGRTYYVKIGSDYWETKNSEPEFVLPKIVFDKKDDAKSCRESVLDADNRKLCSNLYRVSTLLPPADMEVFPPLCEHSDTKTDEVAHTQYSPIAAYHILIFERILATHRLNRDDFKPIDDDALNIELKKVSADGQSVVINLDGPSGDQGTLDLAYIFKNLNQTSDAAHLLSKKVQLHFKNNYYEIKCLVDKPLFDDNLNKCQTQFWASARQFYLLSNEDGAANGWSILVLILIIFVLLGSSARIVIPVKATNIYIWGIGDVKILYDWVAYVFNALIGALFCTILVVSFMVVSNINCLGNVFGISDYGMAWIQPQINMMWTVALGALLIVVFYVVDIFTLFTNMGVEEGKKTAPFPRLTPTGFFVYAEVPPAQIVP